MVGLVLVRLDIVVLVSCLLALSAGAWWSYSVDDDLEIETRGSDVAWVTDPRDEPKEFLSVESTKGSKERWRNCSGCPGGGVMMFCRVVMFETADQSD